MLNFHTNAESTQRYCQLWKSPFGFILVCATEVGVSNVDWYDLSERKNAMKSNDSELQGSSQAALDGVSLDESSSFATDSTAKAEQWTVSAIQQLQEYFEGYRTAFELSLHVHGTAFQQAVWRALADIPYGETRSYKQIAEYIGKPAAVRAIGQANRSNPAAVIVPCHRVIGANGKLVGYAGSHTDLKADLLQMEQTKPQQGNPGKTVASAEFSMETATGSAS